MGTRGMDLTLWLFFIVAGTFIAGWFVGYPVMALYYLIILSGILSILYCPYQILSKKRSRRNGFYNVVLLPIWSVWAKLLIWTSGGRVKKHVRRAFEVHVEVPEGIEMAEFIRVLDRDLKLAEEKYPDTLFIWETSVPLPVYFRTFVREKIKTGEGLWRKGGWPLPRFPFVSRKRKGTLRHGFIINRR